MIYAISRAVICFLLSILVSSLMIRLGLPHLAEFKGRAFPVSGFWIGLFETILVFVFVIEREYTALAIIIVAQQLLARPRESLEKERVYYHLASLTNTAVAIIFALIARAWMYQFLGVFLV